jgi:hypothetical protein
MQLHHIAAIHAYLMLVLGGWRLYTWKGGFGLIAVLLAVVILVMNQGLAYGTKAGKRITLLATLGSLFVIRPLIHDIKFRDDNGMMIWSAILIATVVSLATQLLAVKRGR